MGPLTIALVTAAAALATSLQAQTQGRKVVESTFHRVHLKNGNTVDGQLLSKGQSGVVLMLDAGEFMIRRGLIARVEFIKIRSLEEPPPVIDLVNPDVNPEAVKAAEAAPGNKNETPETPKPTASSARKTSFRPVVMPLNPGPGLQSQVDPLLARILTSPRTLRFKFTDHLADLGAPVAPYLASLLEHLDPSIRQYVVDAIKKINAPTTIPVLAKLTKSESVDIRKDALALLGATGDVKALKAMRPSLKDPDAGVRIAASTNLVTAGNPVAIDWLVDLTTDSDENVRTRALKAAAMLAQNTREESRLLNSIEKKIWTAPVDQRRRLAAALSLGAGRQGWTVLLRLMKDRDAMVRAYAAEGLGKAAAPESHESIVNAISSEREYWPRIQLASAARKMKLREAVPELINWLSDKNEEIRTAASRSLRHITGQNFGIAPNRWTEWWNEASK